MVWCMPESEESQATQLLDYLRENLIDFSQDDWWFRSLSDNTALSLVRKGYSVKRITWLLQKRPDLRIADLCFRGVEMHFRDLRRLAVSRDADGSWLWCDINNFRTLPNDCNTRQINQLGRLEVDKIRLFPSLSRLLASRGADVVPDDMRALMSYFPGVEGYPELCEFIGLGGTLEHIRWITMVKGADGRRISWRPRDATDLKRLIDTRADAWDKLKVNLSFRGPNGGFFNYLEDALAFTSAGGDVDLLQELVSNDCAFNGYEVALIAHFMHNIPQIHPERVKAWLNNKRPLNAAICAEIMSGEVIFRHDGRPKCLLLLACEDFRDGTLAFLDYSETLLNIGFEYDTKIVSGYCRQDFIEALNEVPDDLALLLFGFHGTDSKVELARDLGRYGIPSVSTEREVRKGDIDWLRAISKLPQGCLCVMISCMTARGGKAVTNIASDWASVLIGRGLIASRTKLSLTDIRFESRFPLGLSFDGTKAGITFRADMSPQESLIPYSGEPLRDRDFKRVARRLHQHWARAVFQRLHQAVQNADVARNWSLAEVAWREILEIPKVTEVRRFSNSQHRNMSSFAFVFGMLLCEPWAPVFGSLFDGAASHPWDYLRERGYVFTDLLEEETVVVYVSPQGKDWVARDFGVHRMGMVVRKAWHGFQAPLEFCPAEYSHVVLLRKESQELS